MKKNIFLILFFLFLLMQFTSVFAQQTDPVSSAASKAAADAKAQAEKVASDAGQLKTKIENMTKDIILTLVSLSAFESPFDDFSDIFRNQCQLDEIASLQQIMERTQRDLRRAALAGKENDFQALKKELIRVTIELNYVRNFIDTKDGNYIVKSEGDTYEKLSNSFGALLGDQELRNFISTLTVKYTESAKKYKECNILADWDKVQKRVEKLAKALEQAGKDFSNTVQEPYKKAAQAINSDQARKDGIKMSVKDAIGSYLAEHVSANLPPIPTKLVEDTIKQTAKIVTSIASSERSVSEGKSIAILQKEVNDKAYVFAVQTEVAELRAKYEILYGEAGDNAINDILKKVDTLNSTINNAVNKDLPPMLDCLSQPNARQCTKIK